MLQVGQYPKSAKSVQQLTDRNIFSKFLYYSIMSDEQKDDVASQIAQSIEVSRRSASDSENGASQSDDVDGASNDLVIHYSQ